MGRQGPGGRERQNESDRERDIDVRERSINRLPPVRGLNGNQTHSLGMCPDWVGPTAFFGAWDNAQID